MLIDDSSLPASGQILQISPTDISQFIRLEQCQRYLRLRLHEGAAGRNFMRRAGLTPQAIPPLLTRAGAAFEDTVEAAIAAQFPTYHFASAAGKAQRGSDNAQVVARTQDLLPGATTVLFQARLVVPLDGWMIRGDADILRLERDADGALRVLIADMKSSATAKVEHRLQVAFYHAMLAGLFTQEGVSVATIETAILYRGLLNLPADLPLDEIKRLNDQRDEARTFFGVEEGFLERVMDAEAYLDAVRDLVTGPDSTARQVITQPFAAVPYHLSRKCDGCLYNEFCMQWSAKQDDLSLLPHITALDKEALLRTGVRTVHALAGLKEFAPPDSNGANRRSEVLVPVPGTEALVGRLATTWPVGPRLDELIHRARRYRQWKKEDVAALSYIPNKGHGSLPYMDATHNPNLVRVYLDAQQDYLHNRIYLLGARVVACENGVEVAARCRNVVHLAASPPETDALEADLLVAWIHETLAAVVELAAPDEAGGPMRQFT